MKTAYVIFYLDISEKHATDSYLAKEQEPEPSPDFPQDWNHIGDNSSDSYADTTSDLFRLFNAEETAILWIRANIRSNHVYKVCKWVISENLKVFGNCPELVEVEEA